MGGSGLERRSVWGVKVVVVVACELGEDMHNVNFAQGCRVA